MEIRVLQHVWTTIKNVFFSSAILEYYFFLILMRNGTLHYPNPNDIDKSLNDAAADKIRKYRTDYNSNPPNRETDRFFAVSGVQSVQSNLGSSYSHFRHAAFSSMLKSKCGNILLKVTSQSHTHPSHSETSRLLTSSLSLGVPVPRTTQCIDS
jgi:hypothetical protein